MTDPIDTARDAPPETTLLRWNDDGFLSLPIIGGPSEAASLVLYQRPDIAAAREADLRAALSKHRKVIAKVYGRVVAVVQSISDEGDRVYFGSSNDADILRDLAREWDDARILKEDIRTSEEEGRDLRAEVERLRALLDEAREGLARIAEGNLGAMPWQADYGKIREVARATLAKIGGQ